MREIYLVIGQCEDEYVKIERAFGNLKKAIDYKKQLEDIELMLREEAAMCKNCDGNNKQCPFYVTSFFEEDGCDSYEPSHTQWEFKIETVQYKE